MRDHAMANLAESVRAREVGKFDEFAAGEAAVTKGVDKGRGALRRVLPKAGGKVVPGSLGEQAVQQVVNQKPCWIVIKGPVSARNAAADLRIYGGAAGSPRGRAIELESTARK